MTTAHTILGVVTAFEHETVWVRRRMCWQRRETLAVGRLWRGMLYGREVVLLRCGMGPERAIRAMGWLVRTYRLSGVISAGFAGGLHPALATGDAILPPQILAGSVDAAGALLSVRGAVAPEARWAQLAATAANQAALGSHRGPLLSVTEVVPHAAMKARLGRDTGALAVDMESYPIGRIAVAHSLPFAVLRVVFDACDDEVPLPVSRCTTPDGKLRPALLAYNLFVQPRLCLRLLPLWRQARRAGVCLQTWLDRFFFLLRLDG